MRPLGQVLGFYSTVLQLYFPHLVPISSYMVGLLAPLVYIYGFILDIRPFKVFALTILWSRGILLHSSVLSLKCSPKACLRRARSLMTP